MIMMIMMIMVIMIMTTNIAKAKQSLYFSTYTMKMVD